MGGAVTNVLIANRAEIASRVIRTCRSMGIRTVAVFSEADAGLPYVREADAAVGIGPAAPAQSYLDAGKIIAAARASGADAIHPGYGFLSESPAFARAVRDAGLTFIGPTPEAMERLGSKTDAKAVAVAAGVPVVPWFEVKDDAEALKQAAEIGFPVMVKPAAGGGGKGMYRCDNAEELAGKIVRARREAVSAFGSDVLLVEKFLVNPRHIEVQILADEYGTVLHLFERECSIQRRNQKLIEESPSPILTPKQRAEICGHAVRIASTAGYTNAGTCEFLYDTSGNAGGTWYFCEMNTRLQVEHPVTETVTGLDLVELQLRVARGEKLALKQSDVVQRGHAIELRMISEDPFTGFTPSLGTIEHFRLPRGDGIRVDAGYTRGDTVTPHYDSLLAKLIARGSDRADAIARAKTALHDWLLMGVQTCAPFHAAMLNDAGFVGGQFHIHYAEARMSAGLLKKPAADDALLAAALTAWRSDEKVRGGWSQPAGRGLGAWTASALRGVR
jgi:acetyl/propionyl-CoA carboxylase alpha subunit